MKLHLPVRLRAALLKSFDWAQSYLRSTATTTASLSLSFAALSALCLQASAIESTALPTDGDYTVQLGDASMSTVGSDLTVSTEGSKVAIDWTSFDIGKNASVTFQQYTENPDYDDQSSILVPEYLLDSTAVVLNRVTGDSITTIDGSLSANGIVFLVNTNGILFGTSSSIDVAGLLASTLDISVEDFESATDTYTFEKVGSDFAEIINKGSIETGDDGFIYLVSDRVTNSANGQLVVGKEGTIGIGAGTKATINLSESGLLSFVVEGEATKDIEDEDDTAEITNSGTIKADGGHVVMTASTARALASSVIKNENVISANSLDELMGTVSITATGGSVTNTSTGSITADAGNEEAPEDEPAWTEQDDIADGPAGTINIVADSVVNTGLISANSDYTSQENQSVISITATNGGISGTGSSSNIIADTAILSATSEEYGEIGTSYVLDTDSVSYVYLTALNTQVSNLTVNTSSILQSNNVATGYVSIANSGDLDLVLDINTNGGSTDSAGYASVIVTNDGGSITGHVIAYSGDFTADSDIYLTDALFSTFAASVTGSGDITLINDSDGLTVSSMVASLNGESAFSSAGVQQHTSGNINLSQTGTIYLMGEVSAGESVTITSSTSHITSASYLSGYTDTSSLAGFSDDELAALLGSYDIAVSGIVSGNKVTLSAAGAVNSGFTVNVGDVSDANAGLYVTSGSVVEYDDDGNATTVGGVSLSGVSGLNIKSILAEGEAGDVYISTSSGDIELNADSGLTAITATGVVSLSSTAGAILDYNSPDTVAVMGTDLVLSAYNSIAYQDSSTQELSQILVSSDIATITASSSYGSILISRGRETDATNTDLWLNITAGAEVNITQNGGGDTSLYYVSAGDAITLKLSGQLSQDSTASSIYSLNSASLTLSADSIEGTLYTSISSTESGINYSITTNNGDMTLQNSGDIEAALDAGTGKIDLTNASDLGLHSIVGSEVTLYSYSYITDANGDSENISALTLNITYAMGFGTSDDAIELNLGSETEQGEINAYVRSGGLYIQQGTTTQASSLYVNNIQSSGDVYINTYNDLKLGSIVATLKTVYINTNGYNLIVDSPTSGSVNVESYQLSYVTNAVAGELLSDVTMMSAVTATGDLDINNSGFLYITLTNLVPVDNNGAPIYQGQNITIKSAGMAIFDNNGGTTTLYEDSSLTLIATDGNIVFLNTEDTISLLGNATFTAIATGTSSGTLGYVGNIILGNITTENTDISVTADGNISIAHLDAGSASVNLTSGGYIIDNNGDLNNITASYVSIYATSLDESDLLFDTVYATIDTSSIKTLLQAYTIDQALNDVDLLTYAALVIATKQVYDETKADYDTKKETSEDLEFNVEALFISVQVAEYATEAAEAGVMISKAVSAPAQGVPLVGDGGAMTVTLAFEIAARVCSTLETALNTAYEILEMKANDAGRALSTAEATMNAAKYDWNNAVDLQEGVLSKQEMLTTLISTTEAQLLASAQLEDMANIAYSSQNAIGSESLGLGINAATVYITNDDSIANTEQGSIYIQSTEGIGLNDIVAQGSDSVIVVDAQGVVAINGGLTAGASIEINTASSISSLAGASITTREVGSSVDMSAYGDIVINNAPITTEAYARVSSTTGSITLGDITAAGTDYTSDIYVLVNPEVNSFVEIEAYISITLDGSTISSEDYIVMNAKNGAITLLESATTGCWLETDELVLNAYNGIGTASNMIGIRVNTVAAYTSYGDIALKTDEECMVIGSVTLPATSTVLGGENISGLIVANQGNIYLTASNDIDIQQGIFTPGNVTINCLAGGLYGTEDSDNVPQHIVASGLTITAQKDVTLRTNVDTLNTTLTGDGSLLITEYDDITLNSILVADGSVDLTAGGSITVVDITISNAETEANSVTLISLTADIIVGSITLGTGVADVADVYLTAAGNILNDGDNTSAIQADELVMQAGTGIGVDGASTDVTSLNTQVNSITASTTTGSVHIAEADDLVIQSITATNQVTVQSAEGSLEIVLIDTQPSEDNDTNITLLAKKAIINKRTDDAAALIASNMSISAGTGIGTEEEALLVEADTLEAYSVTGDIVISDISGDLAIADVTPNIDLPALTGVQAAAGQVILSTVGELTVEETLIAGTNISLEAGQDINIDAALDAGADMTLSSTEGSITTTATLDADNNVNLGAADAITIGAAVTADAGEIDMDAVHDIAINGALEAGTDITLTSTEGSVTTIAKLDADDNVIVTAGNAITIGAAVETFAGEIDMKAVNNIDINGALDAGTDLSLSSKSGSVTTSKTLDAGVNIIVQSADDITIGAAATALVGEIDMKAVNDIDINGALDAGTDLALSSKSGSVTTSEMLDAGVNIIVKSADLITIGAATTAGAMIDMDADNDIAINGALKAGTDITLSSTEGSVTTTESLGATDNVFVDVAGAITIGAAVTALMGEIDMEAVNDIAINGALKAGTDITLSSTEGSVTTTETLGATDNVFVDAGNAITTDAAITALIGEIDLKAVADIAINGALDAGTDITLSSTEGSVTTTESLGATDNVLVDAAGAITIGAGVTADTGKIDMEAVNDIAINGTFDAGTDITLTSKSGSVTTTKTLDADVNIIVKSADAISIDAGVTAGAMIDMDAVNDIDIDGALSAGRDITLTSTEGSIITTETLDATDNIILDAGNAITIGEDVTADTGEIDMEAVNDIVINGALDAGIDITLTSTEGSVKTTATLDADGNVLVDAAGAITIGAAVTALMGEIDMEAVKDIAINGALDAGTDITLSSTEGSITTKNVLESTNNVYLDAANAITTDAAITALIGEIDLKAVADIAINGALDAGTDITLSSTEGSVTTTEKLDATDNVFIDAGNAITIGAGVTVGVMIDMEADNDIAINGTLKAGTDITLTSTEGSVTTTEKLDATDNVFVDAAGAITIGAGVTADTGKIDMDAGSDITLDAPLSAASLVDLSSTQGDIVINSTISAADSVTLDAQGGAIMAGTLSNTDQNHIETDSLVASSQSGIASTGPALLTDIDEATLSTTGQGDINIVELDGIELVKVNVADGSLAVEATAGDIIVGCVAATELVRLNSAQGSVSKADDNSLLSADELHLDAHTGIALNTAVNSLSIVNGSGGVDIAELDSIELDSIQSASDVQVVAADGDIYVDDIMALGQKVILEASGSILELGSDSENDITAASLEMAASTGSIGTQDEPIELDIDTLAARAATGIYLNVAGDLSVQNVTAGEEVALQIEGSISSEVGTIITTDALAISAGTGIDIVTAVNSIDADSTLGDIDISQSGELQINKLIASAGDISVDATGSLMIDSIVAESGDISLVTQDAMYDINDIAGEPVMNITGNRISLIAENGIGIDNPIEISAKQLIISSDKNDVVIEVEGSITLDDITVGEGNLVVVTTDSGAEDDNITINKDIVMDDGYNIYLSADDDFIQNADLTAEGEGNITVIAGGDIISLDGVSTSTEAGNINYTGASVEIPYLKSLSGWVTISGDSFTASQGALIEALYVKFYTESSDDKSAIEHLLKENEYMSHAVWLNDRLVAGLLNKNTDFINEAGLIDNEKYDLQYPLLYENTDYSRLHIDDDAWESEGFSSDDENERLIFGEIQ